MSDTSSLTPFHGRTSATQARAAKVVGEAFAVQALLAVDKGWTVTVGHKAVGLKEAVLTPGNGKGFTNFVTIEELSSSFLSGTLRASVCFNGMWTCRMVLSERGVLCCIVT